VGLSKSVALAESRASLVGTLFSLCVITVVALLCAWFVGEVSVLRQMRQLVDVSQRLAAGEQGVRVQLRGGSREFQQFSRTFDYMAAALDRDRENLEDQVRERTAALTEANRASRLRSKSAASGREPCALEQGTGAASRGTDRRSLPERLTARAGSGGASAGPGSVERENGRAGTEECGMERFNYTVSHDLKTPLGPFPVFWD